MGVKKIEALDAFQLATEFKLEVYRLVNESPAASRDLKFRSQLFEAASGIEATIAEGFGRFLLPEYAQFVRYALGSLKESEVRVTDGVHRGHWTDKRCEHARALGRRCRSTLNGLHASLRREIAKKKALRKKPIEGVNPQKGTGGAPRDRAEPFR